MSPPSWVLSNFPDAFININQRTHTNHEPMILLPYNIDIVLSNFSLSKPIESLQTFIVSLWHWRCMQIARLKLHDYAGFDINHYYCPIKCTIYSYVRNINCVFTVNSPVFTWRRSAALTVRVLSSIFCYKQENRNHVQLNNCLKL